MFGLDEWIASHGGGWIFVVIVGAFLGLRHATDPDHLSALLTLRLKHRQRTPHYLGLFWGVGHALSMMVVGIPLIFFFGELPDNIQKSLEFLVGCVIAFLAIRVVLSIVFFKTDNHSHQHHDGLEHTHPHTHSGSGHTHRSGKTAFAIGVLHGSGGSAGAVALVLSRMPNHFAASAALAILSVFTAVSMAFFSWMICRGLDTSEKIIDFQKVALAGSIGAFLFGVWYAFAAFEVVPYPL